MHWCKWMFWIFEFNSEQLWAVGWSKAKLFWLYPGGEGLQGDGESCSETEHQVQLRLLRKLLSVRKKMVKQNSSSFSHLESQANLTKCGEINMVKKKLLKLLIAESQANFRDYPPNFWSCQNNAKLPAYDQPYVSCWMSSISSINCPNNFCLKYLIYTTWSYHSSMYLPEKRKN